MRQLENLIIFFIESIFNRDVAHVPVDAPALTHAHTDIADWACWVLKGYTEVGVAFGGRALGRGKGSAINMYNILKE